MFFSSLEDSSDDVWESGCGGGPSDGIQWSPVLVGSPTDTPDYFSGNPESSLMQRDGACAEATGVEGDDEGEEGRDEDLDDLARELDCISSDGEDYDLGGDKGQEESDATMARAMQVRLRLGYDV